MESKTGKLDQLIEEKVDNKIEEFTLSIRNQITKFLKDNGDYTGDYLYTVKTWKGDYNGRLIPDEYSYIPLSRVQNGLIGGIEMLVKEKMITKETKELLEKVNLLS